MSFREDEADHCSHPRSLNTPEICTASALATEADETSPTAQLEAIPAISPTLGSLSLPRTPAQIPEGDFVCVSPEEILHVSHSDSTSIPLLFLIDPHDLLDPYDSHRSCGDDTSRRRSAPETISSRTDMIAVPRGEPRRASHESPSDMSRLGRSFGWLESADLSNPDNSDPYQRRSSGSSTCSMVPRDEISNVMTEAGVSLEVDSGSWRKGWSDEEQERHVPQRPMHRPRALSDDDRASFRSNKFGCRSRENSSVTVTPNDRLDDPGPVPSGPSSPSSPSVALADLDYSIALNFPAPPGRAVSVLSTYTDLHSEDWHPTVGREKSIVKSVSDTLFGYTQGLHQTEDRVSANQASSEDTTLSFVSSSPASTSTAPVLHRASALGLDGESIASNETDIVVPRSTPLELATPLDGSDLRSTPSPTQGVNIAEASTTKSSTSSSREVNLLAAHDVDQRNKSRTSGTMPTHSEWFESGTSSFHPILTQPTAGIATCPVHLPYLHISTLNHNLRDAGDQLAIKVVPPTHPLHLNKQAPPSSSTISGSSSVPTTPNFDNPAQLPSLASPPNSWAALSRRHSKFTAFSGGSSSTSSLYSSDSASLRHGNYSWGVGEKPDISTVFEEDIPAEYDIDLSSTRDKTRLAELAASEGVLPLDELSAALPKDLGPRARQQGDYLQAVRHPILTKQQSHQSLADRSQHSHSHQSQQPLRRSHRSDTLSSQTSATSNKSNGRSAHPFASVVVRPSSPQPIPTFRQPKTGLTGSKSLSNLLDSSKMQPDVAPAHQVTLSPSDVDDVEQCPVCLEGLDGSFRLPGEKGFIIAECGHAVHQVSSIFLAPIGH